MIKPDNSYSTIKPNLQDGATRRIYNKEICKNKNLNVLIIDDDKNVSESLKDYLETRGHTVCVVDEGSSGIYQMFNLSYDLVFLDYHLDNDGSPVYDAIEKKQFVNSKFNGCVMMDCIKNIFGTSKKKPIVFGYTGDSNKNIINEIRDAGLSGVIFKPVDVSILNRLMTVLETQKDHDLLCIDKIIKKSKNMVVF